MIDIAEYTRWLELEARMHGKEPHNPYITYCAFWNTPIGWVRVAGLPQYYWHPRFGVVKAMVDGGYVISKSPLCVQLDLEIFGA
jgi:hypothetical protein